MGNLGLIYRDEEGFKDLDKAADHTEQLKEAKADVYVGCGLQGKDLGPQRRGSKSDITGIPGFYVDIDVVDGMKTIDWNDRTENRFPVFGQLNRHDRLDQCGVLSLRIFI